MMNDNILDGPLFSRTRDDDSADFYENIMTRMKEAGIELPSFYTFEPEKDLHVITWSKENNFQATGISEPYESLVELCDYIDSLHGKHEHTFTFDSSVEESPTVDSVLDESMVFMAGDGLTSRMLIGYVNEKTMVYYSYYKFLALAKRWIENPDDMLLAYDFTQFHPAFWFRYEGERYEHQWVTDKGQKSVWVCPAQNDKGEVVVMMEHGAAVEPHRYHHYHDFRLDVWGKGFDDAYIQLAKLTHKFFDLSGESRPDVDYVKQDIEIELEDRLSEYNKRKLELEEK